MHQTFRVGAAPFYIHDSPFTRAERSCCCSQSQMKNTPQSVMDPTSLPELGVIVQKPSGVTPTRRSARRRGSRHFKCDLNETGLKAVRFSVGVKASIPFMNTIFIQPAARARTLQASQAAAGSD